jgi:(R,R)-butanediol dehydrogenase / meso-butanediol dehydrogenase / diacetyl reductase
MRAAVWHGPRDIRIEDVPEPSPGPGQIVLSVARNGICGSDLHTYTGTAGASMHVPGVVLGHEFAGTVVARGDGVDDIAEGTVVAVAPIEWCGECWACRNGHPNVCRELALYGGWRLPLHGGLAPLVAVSRRSVFEVPDGLGAVDAALTEPLAVAVHAARMVPIAEGTSVAVLGAGPIGLGVLQAVVAAGASVTLVSEMSSARRHVADAVGATAVLNPADDDLGTAARDLTEAGVDIVFDTTGVSAALNAGISALRPHGTLVNVAQWAQPAAIDMGRALSREIDLRFSMTYDPAVDFPIALAYLASGAVDAGRMISDHIALDDLVELGLEELLHHADRHVKILVDSSA